MSNHQKLFQLNWDMIDVCLIHPYPTWTLQWKVWISCCEAFHSAWCHFIKSISRFMFWHSESLWNSRLSLRQPSDFIQAQAPKMVDLFRYFCKSHHQNVWSSCILHSHSAAYNSLWTYGHRKLCTRLLHAGSNHSSIPWTDLVSRAWALKTPAEFAWQQEISTYRLT